MRKEKLEMMRIFKICTLLILIGLGTISCVSKKKYSELSNLKNNIQGLLDENVDSLSSIEEESAVLKEQLNDCETEADRLLNLNAKKDAEIAELNTQLSELQTSCNDLEGRYKQLKSQSSQKIQDLIDDLEGLQSDLAIREKRLNQLEQELNRRDSALSSLRNSINQALLGFVGDDLSIERKDGKVYVTLANKLLFASGSTSIDKKGNEALGELGKALADQSDITIMVEGHTDNVPVSNLGDIKDNWDLSVMRSTEVVRILVNAGVNPQQILPAGRGQTTPKVEGSTSEARAQNRRTEIILTPKWGLLYELIEEKK